MLCFNNLTCLVIAFFYSQSDPTYNTRVQQNSILGKNGSVMSNTDMDVEYDNSAFRTEQENDRNYVNTTLRDSERTYLKPVNSRAARGVSAMDGTFGARGAGVLYTVPVPVARPGTFGGSVDTGL